MLILVINAGSSSIKYQLLNMETTTVVSKGLVERIGTTGGQLTHRYLNGNSLEKKTINQEFPDHTGGMKLIIDLLTDTEIGVIKSLSEINAVGHRIVQGGGDFNAPVLITDEVKKKIEEMNPLAPLHNPANLLGIEVAQQFFPNIPQVAVFDTAFHQTMPPRAYRYAIPEKFYTENKIRSYGAHGTSHKYVREQAAKYLNNEHAKVITIHLGNGSSITAINEKGESIDTSMGFTPLNGLVMGTRCGDIDPSVLIYMVRECGVKFEELDDLLNKKSGMLGMTGHSDARDIENLYKAGDEKATLCLDLYSYRVKKYIGAYMAALNGADAIVFTAGIGENDFQLRSLICKNMDYLGIQMDDSKNKEYNSPDEIKEVQSSDSKLKILLIPTNEELEIANNTLEIISKK
ncbi:acetate kinase [Apibacter muscae]|uniref:acetate/propionate family kinase n=1 Tax=Apibacter muscae TaxID=2509004 RepID=UPI0011ACF1F9|nr:acetate kinase [Apibacter muscae]TWP23400.1 acetate kinase [Apibacter muscae]TWP27930.1 acetate kinase [Apibacter muscae]